MRHLLRHTAGHCAIYTVAMWHCCRHLGVQWVQRKFSRRIKVFTPGVLLGLTFEPNNIAGTSPKRVVMEAINPKPMHTTTAGDSPLHTTTSSSLDIALRDPSLLRGCTAGTLLNDCSSVFSSNILGKDEVSIMHKNTAQVDKLDDFVSHSWRTDRWTKWGALLLHFNGDAALAAMLTVNLSIHALEAFSIIPTIFPVRVHAINMDGTTWIYNQSGMPQICGWLATFIFFLNWQEMRAWLPTRFVAPRYAFLDKICIDQEDDARKSAGIASLGAFLAHSKTLLVLFSPEYFTRLWCCYELAAFHKVQSAEQQMKFMPVAFPRLLYIAFFTQLLSFAYMCLIGIVRGPDLEMNDPYVPLTAVFMLVGGVLLVMDARRYLKERAQVDAQIASFSIAHAECFDPADRERVLQNVAHWFGNGDRQKGITAFDAHVHVEIRQLVEEVVGKGVGSIPYKWCFLAASPQILNDLAGTFRYLPLYPDPLVRLSVAIFNFACSFLAAPAIPLIALWIASWRVWNRPLADPLRVLACICAFPVSQIVFSLMDPTTMLFGFSPLGVALMCAVFLLCSIPLALYFWREECMPLLQEGCALTARCMVSRVVGGVSEAKGAMV